MEHLAVCLRAGPIDVFHWAYLPMRPLRPHRVPPITKVCEAGPDRHVGVLSDERALWTHGGGVWAVGPVSRLAAHADPAGV
jgi:hypothetical protein